MFRYEREHAGKNTREARAGYGLKRSSVGLVGSEKKHCLYGIDGRVRGATPVSYSEGVAGELCGPTDKPEAGTAGHRSKQQRASARRVNFGGGMFGGRRVGLGSKEKTAPAR